MCVLRDILFNPLPTNVTYVYLLGCSVIPLRSYIYVIGKQLRSIQEHLSCALFYETSAALEVMPPPPQLKNASYILDSVFMSEYYFL